MTLEFLLFSGNYDDVIAQTSTAEAVEPALVGALALSGRLDEAESAFRTLVASGASPEAAIQARFFVVAGLCHAGNLSKALRLVRASLRDRGLPHQRSQFWIWQGLALVRFFEGRFRRSRAAGKRALATAMETAFPYARVLALDLLAHVLVHTGALHAGIRLLDQAASLAESLGYSDNATTLRTSRVIYQLQFLLVDVNDATRAVVEAVAVPEVSFFTRRSGLIELAMAWALQGEGARAQAALDDARRIALPGLDRRGKTRWLGAQALLTALSQGGAAARPFLDEAREAAHDQLTLQAELGFVEAVFVGTSERLERTLPLVAQATGVARAELASAKLRGTALPHPAHIEDGLGRVLLHCWQSEPAERIDALVAAGLLGLLPWALGLLPGRRFLLTTQHLITEHHGRVTVAPAPTGPSLRVLLALRSGLCSREALAHDVWGLARFNPTKHSAVINTAVSRLRLSMGEPTWLVTHESGYHLAEGVELAIVEQTTAVTTATTPPPARPEEGLVIDLLRREGATSSVEVARALRMSSSSALRLLRGLVEDGRLVRVGSGRATRYSVAE